MSGDDRKLSGDNRDSIYGPMPSGSLLCPSCSARKDNNPYCRDTFHATPDTPQGLRRYLVYPFSDAERDEIVLALRERRVATDERCCEVRKRHGKMEFYLRLEGNRQTYSYLTLDDAERLLGIGGDE